MLSYIDTFLLNKAQKFTDRFQWLTGLTKFWVQKWLIIFEMILSWLLVVVGGEPVAYFVVALYMTFVSTLVVFQLEKREEQFLKGSSALEPEKLLDPEKRKGPVLINMSIFFIFLVLGSEGLDGSFCISAQGAIMILYIYVAACIPRPPDKSKMRQWYERALWWLNDALKPAGESALVPVPVRN